MSRLVIVSNRVPSAETPAAGGLTIALSDSLRDRKGIWFGWSGRLIKGDMAGDVRQVDRDGLVVATVDLPEKDFETYYSGYSNRVLWPAFHLRLDLAEMNDGAYDAYRRINALLAERLMSIINPDDTIWAHDYHLIPLASELRARGFTGPIGFFLHIPFPTPDTLAAIPEHRELIDALFAYDLVGFQTERDLSAFGAFISDHLGGKAYRGAITVGDKSLEVGAFPIGTDPARFSALAARSRDSTIVRQIDHLLAGRKLMIGIDRLDYTKGLAQRVTAYERMLGEHPDIRNKVMLLQVAPPSRSTIAEYEETARELDEACGRVNGHFSEPNWVPLHYIQKAYSQRTISGLYRLARVCLVTPLRDGMNLVAKEFIAAQDPSDPGVLILSRFAGAAEQMKDAIIVNPYDLHEMADAMYTALNMPLDERIERWQHLMEGLRKSDVGAWRENFLAALAATGRTSQMPVASGDKAPGSGSNLSAPTLKTRAQGGAKPSPLH